MIYLIIWAVVIAVILGLMADILFWIFVWQYDRDPLIDVTKFEFDETDFII